MIINNKLLGERHKKILSFIEGYIKFHSYPPSIREIGEQVGISSTSVVVYYLYQLEAAGLIHREKKISRSVIVDYELVEKQLSQSEFLDRYYNL
jgi:repressor LexA